MTAYLSFSSISRFPTGTVLEVVDDGRRPPVDGDDAVPLPQAGPRLRRAGAGHGAPHEQLRRALEDAAVEAPGRRVARPDEHDLEGAHGVGSGFAPRLVSSGF